jgi:hypothetical protein
VCERERKKREVVTKREGGREREKERENKGGRERE